MLRRIAVCASAVGVLLIFWWGAVPDRRAPSSAGEAVEFAPTPPATEPSRGRPPATDRPAAAPSTPCWKLAVEVRDPDGRPHARALVRFLADDGTEIDRGDTNARGVAFLRVGGAGRAVATRVQPFYPARSDPVSPGTERVVIQLAGGELTIAGRVLDSNEEVDATVTAKVGDPATWIGDWRWVGHPLPAPKGRFRIGGLQPGRHALSVRVRNTRGLPPREPVIAAAGDDDVVIRLREVCWLTFQWVDARTGLPVTERRSVRWLDHGEERVASASGPGAERLVRAWVDPGAALQLTAAAEGYLTQSAPVQIVAGEKSRKLSFRMVPDPESLVEVELVLRDNRGDPVTEITIMRDGLGTTHRSDDGRVLMKLPAGKNRLRFGPLIRDHRSPWVVRFLDLDLERGGRRTINVEIQRCGWLRQPRWEGKLVRNARIVGSEERFIYFARNDRRACLAPGRHVVEADLPDGRRLRGEVEVTADRISEVELVDAPE